MGVGYIIKHHIAKNLWYPKKGVWSWYTNKWYEKENAYLHKNAARLCNIEPHHHVLQLDFRSGIGIQEACKSIQDGSGKISGLEKSEYMLECAWKRLTSEVQKNKAELTFGSVINLPYASDSFDRIFHVDSYYFWPELPLACAEIHRVMKPDSFMVTVLNMATLKQARDKGIMKYAKTDLIRYMSTLEMVGFTNVHVEYMQDGQRDFQAIFAELRTKGEYVKTDEKR